MIFPSRLSGVNVKTRLLHDQHPHSMTGIVRSSPESPARLTLELPMIKQSSRVITGNAMLAFMFIHSCKGVLFHRIKAGFVFMSSSLVTCQIIRFRDSVVSLFPGTLLRMSLLSVTQPHVSFFHARTGIHHDILARIGHTSCAKQCYLPCMRCSYSASLCRELPRNCRSAREVANCAPQAFSSPSATA